MAAKFPSWIVNLLVSLLGPIVGLLTPQLRGLIESTLKDWYAKAKETESPFDDVLVRIIAALLDVPLEG